MGLSSWGGVSAGGVSPQKRYGPLRGTGEINQIEPIQEVVGWDQAGFRGKRTLVVFPLRALRGGKAR